MTILEDRLVIVNIIIDECIHTTMLISSIKQGLKESEPHRARLVSLGPSCNRRRCVIDISCRRFVIISTRIKPIRPARSVLRFTHFLPESN